MTAVHAQPRAERRREKNNVRGPFGAVPAEQSLARIIGETVALRIAEIVPELTWTPACAVCCREVKRAERDHNVAVANAKAAAEPLPDVPQVQVNQAFTIDPDYGPVCWDHVRPKLTFYPRPDSEPEPDESEPFTSTAPHSRQWTDGLQRATERLVGQAGE